MQISTFTDYCLRILIFLSITDDGLTTTKDIAARYNISFHHAAKASKWLVREGYADSVRGKYGGISMAMPLEKIRLGDLVRKANGNKKPIDCGKDSGKMCVIHGACGLPDIFETANEAYYQALNNYSLKDAVLNKVGISRLLQNFV